MSKTTPAAPAAERQRIEEADVLPRRNVLRGALAAGCSVLVPASLFGCGRQEDADSASGEAAAPAPSPGVPERGGTAGAPGGSNQAPTAATPQPAKVSQASVQYQDQPKGAQKCGNCIQFIPPNACKVVDGVISPEGWCALWVGQT